MTHIGGIKPMTQLRTYRINLGWSQNKLALEAGISPSLIKRAETGMPVQARTAKLIADALSKAYGRQIQPADLEGLAIM